MNKIKFIALTASLALAMAFTFSCSSDGGGGDDGGNTGLNGTWDEGEQRWVMNNGNFTYSENNTEMFKGTYSASGSNLTVTVTEVKGALFGSDGADIGLSQNQWYTQSSLRTAVINYFVSQGMSQSDAQSLYNSEIAPLTADVYITQGGPYTLNGNILVWDGDTYTKQGGTTNPGSGGTFTLTDIPSKYNGKYAYISGMTEDDFVLWGGIDDDDEMSLFGPDKAVRISNGKVSIPMWVFKAEASMFGERYKDYGTAEITVIIQDSEPVYLTSMAYSLGMISCKQVSFSNGSATKSWNAADVDVAVED